jgi:glutaredoxin
VLKDDTQKLLLTWVDEKGDFHVVQKVADVPEAARTAVRVVLTDKEAGTGAVVYVADLRSKNSDGSYLVKTMARGQWDEVGAARRKQRLEALLAPPAASAGSEAPRPGATGGEANPKARSATVIAVVYGADWCKPCHDAERYLRQKGVTVIKKDIEQSDGARAELQSKLQRAGLPASASIPIIDVMGRMIVGFSPGALDRALDAVRASQTL